MNTLFILVILTASIVFNIAFTRVLYGAEKFRKLFKIILIAAIILNIFLSVYLLTILLLSIIISRSTNTPLPVVLENAAKKHE